MNVSLFVRKSGNAFVALYIVLSQRRYAVFIMIAKKITANFRTQTNNNIRWSLVIFLTMFFRGLRGFRCFGFRKFQLI